MANELLPAIDASGKWKLKAPFDTQLATDVAYTCKEIRKLSAVVAAGFDAKAEWYDYNEIPEATYNQHVADDISVITLVSSTGAWLNVPSPYLDGWPSADVVPYVVIGMIADLGPLPNTIDPGFLTTKVKNLIKDTLGHEPDIQYVALSEVTNKAFADHEALETLRQTNITDSNTDYARRLKAEDELVKAKAEIAALQQFILDSGVTIPVVTEP